MIPDLNAPGTLEKWRRLEHAKHRVIYSVKKLKIPLKSKREDPIEGLEFDFLSDEIGGSEPVMTGHANGVVTINIDEADPAEREVRRVQMGEKYRTLIGHVRHEIGHFYWDRLVRDSGETLKKFRTLFGDERADYGEALSEYHDNGPPADWAEHFVSEYSSAHPWEDWAETWAHYFHLVDSLETAYSFNLQLNPKGVGDLPWSLKCDFDPYLSGDIQKTLDSSRVLAYAVNSLNRSMGQPDLYPFVIPPEAVEKLKFIHEVIRNASTEGAAEVTEN
ncbi:UNVERIFIED_CONTAM: hypothetical protein GTU68_005215 [Idotea baltica]|nr:hypothetical protein [Idotea baltica]